MCSLLWWLQSYVSDHVLAAGLGCVATVSLCIQQTCSVYDHKYMSCNLRLFCSYVQRAMQPTTPSSSLRQPVADMLPGLTYHAVCCLLQCR